MVSSRAAKIKPSATMALNAKVSRMIKEGRDVINLTAGEPDFDTPDNIKEAAIRAIKGGFTKYTAAEGTEELRAAVSEKLKRDNNLGYSTGEIIVSNGSKHSLYNAILSLVNEGDEVIIPVPYWVSYSEQVRVCGGVPVFAETENFRLDVSKVKEKINRRTKAIIINSPNNPSGAVYEKEALKELAELSVKHDFFILSDEIYEKLVYGKRHHSIASFAKGNTIVINGVSKAYAMTGWRIGYAAGPEEIIKAMSKIQSQASGNPNSIAQKAALEALAGDQNTVEVMRKEFEKRRNFVVKRLNEIGLALTKPEGAFYAFPEVNGNSMDTASKLLDAGVAVVPGIEFGMEGHIRISYATSMQKLEEGMKRIEKFVGQQ